MAERQATHQPAPRQIVTGNAPGRILQRACACWKHAGNGGECEECRSKRLGTLQRSATSAAPDGTDVPPIVHEVIRSPGQPLDADTLEFMEPRFGHDFSRVRVHTGTSAAQSARAVNALAWTVGDDIVFGAGRYRPDEAGGRSLLAHELTHVMQQRRSGPVPQGKLQLGGTGDPAEDQAERTARMVMDDSTVPPTTQMESTPVLRRFSEGEHQRIGQEAYDRAFGETQSAGQGSSTPPLDESLVNRLKGFSFQPGGGASYTYGQMVAIADNIASFDMLEQKANQSKGSRIPLLSAVWDMLGDNAHYLDLAARNTAHFHPHNYLSWQPWHWQALRTMHQAWQAGEDANRLQADYRALLVRFDALSTRTRAAIVTEDRARQQPGADRSNERIERALAEMQRLLAQAQQKQAQYAAKRAEANDMAVRAMAMSGFGDHFLTDAFAAGHIVTPRQQLLTEYSTQLLGFIPVGGVLNCANIPSLAWHDLDNSFGVDVDNMAGDSWTTYGDDYGDTVAKGDIPDQSAAPTTGKSLGPTMDHVIKATSLSIGQMWQAAKGQQPTNLRPVLDQLPRPKLANYPKWGPDDWDRQLRFAAGEQLGQSPDATAAPKGPAEEPPNPKGHQIGSGIASARATCLDLIDRFAYRDFVIPMIDRTRKEYATRYFTGRSEQMVSPSTAPTPQASVTGRVVLGSLIGAGLGALAGGLVGGLLIGGLAAGLIGAGVGLVGGFLLGGLIGGLFGKRRDQP